MRVYGTYRHIRFRQERQHLFKAHLQNFVEYGMAHGLAETHVEESLRSRKARGKLRRGQPLARFSPDHLHRIQYARFVPPAASCRFAADYKERTYGCAALRHTHVPDSCGEHLRGHVAGKLKIDLDAGKRWGFRFAEAGVVVNPYDRYVARDVKPRGAACGANFGRCSIVCGEDPARAWPCRKPIRQARLARFLRFANAGL